MLFSTMNKPTSTAFAPFTPVFVECKEFETVMVRLVAKGLGIVHIGEFDPVSFHLLLDNGREVECSSEGDVLRVITELGIRGEFDGDISFQI